VGVLFCLPVFFCCDASVSVSVLVLQFPDAYIHNGGDEVTTTCWEQSAKIQAWMKTKGYTDIKQVRYLFACMRVRLDASGWMGGP
jgi:N-acetyl-beta-hexosaminidase